MIIYLSYIGHTTQLFTLHIRKSKAKVFINKGKYIGIPTYIYVPVLYLCGITALFTVFSLWSLKPGSGEVGVKPQKSTVAKQLQTG